MMRSKEQSELRAEIGAAIERKQYAAAQAGLEVLWSGAASPVLAPYVTSSYGRIAPHLHLTPFRLAILRSYAVEPLIPVLRAAACAHRIDLKVTAGGYNSYVQEILDTTNPVYREPNNAIFLSLQAADIVPELWDGYADLDSGDVNRIVARTQDDFTSWVRTLRASTAAHIVLQTLEIPATSACGELDHQSPTSQAEALFRINQHIRSIAASTPGVHVLDYGALVARYGRENWHDPHKWAIINMPFRAERLTAVAEAWMRIVCPLAGRTAKVLVTDLDDTLWHGVVGEEGIDGIQAGKSHPGCAYRAVQRALLDCSRRGVLLAICSKNNRDDVLPVFDRHPDMVLRMEHFSADRMNWNPKPDNLREIAAELNLGMDSLVFLDDNPAERKRVRLECPEVTVIELPDDPMEYARLVRDCPQLQRLSVSGEDRDRKNLYQVQRQRAEMERQAQTVEDYYRQLAQEVELQPAASATLSRVAQLTQKTNQFNLTTRRYSEQEIKLLAEDPAVDVYAARVTDRFGDNGITAVMITRTSEVACEIDTFLLSCRIISRTVETALLAHLVEQCRARGIRLLRGWFLPTAKNAPAADFYRTHGFTPGDGNGSGVLWTLDVTSASIQCPPWIQLRTAVPEVTHA